MQRITLLAALLLTACGGRLAALDEGVPAYAAPEHHADAGPDGAPVACDQADAGPVLFRPCDPWAAANPCPDPYFCTVDAWGRNPGCTVWWGSPLCTRANWVPLLRDEGSAMVCAPK